MLFTFKGGLYYLKTWWLAIALLCAFMTGFWHAKHNVFMTVFNVVIVGVMLWPFKVRNCKITLPNGEERVQ